MCITWLATRESPESVLLVDYFLESWIHDSMAKTDEQKLQRLIQVFTKIMDQEGVTAFLSFGALLGAMRLGKRMPWDDDTDFMVDHEQMILFVSTLDYSPAVTPWCSARSGRVESKEDFFSRVAVGKTRFCGTFWLDQSESIMLTWKDWGMPFKVHFNTRYPGGDINSYIFDAETNQEPTITIPKAQLSGGHVHAFSVPASLMFPAKRIKFEGVNVSIPQKPIEVLDSLYPMWDETCIMSKGHHGKMCFNVRDNDDGDDKATQPKSKPESGCVADRKSVV